MSAAEIDSLGSCQMEDNHAPPPLSIKLPKSSELPIKSKRWSNDSVDVALLTVEDCEFLACHAFMRNPIRRYHKYLGHVYFGSIGDGNEDDDDDDNDNNQLKVALLKCFAGSSGPGAAQVVVNDAVRILMPRAVFSVGYCEGLMPEKTRLGDVVVSSKLTFEDLKTPVGKSISHLIKHSGDGWKPPLERPDDAHQVKVHDGEILSCKDKETAKQLQSGAIAREMEGQGFFVVAHNLKMEWIIVKGISHFADSNKIPEESWKSHACVMAASLVFNMLTVVCEEWPHYKGSTPAYVRARGKRACEAYSRALANGTTYDTRVKILLVGQDRVGKTSVGKCLRGEPFDKDEPSTDGVQMIPPVKNAGTEAWKNPVSLENTTVFDHKISTEITRELLSTPVEKAANKRNMTSEDGELSSAVRLFPLAAPDYQPAQSPEPQQETSQRNQKKHIEEQPKNLDTMPQEVASLVEDRLKENQIESEDKIWPSIWDFAGQDIFRAIHPIFMSPEDIYLLVVDLTKTLSATAECRVNPRGHAEYTVPARDSEDTNLDHILRWMDVIHSLKNCDENVLSPDLPSPPVILLGTHADLVDPSKEIGLLRKNCEEVLDERFAEHIVECLPIDNTKAGKTTDQEQIVILRKKILELAIELPHTKKEIPLQWHRVEKEISVQEKKYLSKEAFRKQIASQYCKFDNEDDFDELVHFLHARGSIVYYEHTGNKDDLVFLDPQWLINVLSEIINAKSCDGGPMWISQHRKKLQKKGILSRRLLDLACTNLKLGPIKDSLISLMEKFNLICKWPAEKPQHSLILVPCMLTSASREGNTVEEMTTNCCAPVYLTFDGTNYVPGGLFCRLVVLFGRWLAKPKYTDEYKLHANEAQFALDKNHNLHLVCYKRVIKLFISGAVSMPNVHCANVLSHLKEFLETLKKKCHWLHSMSEEVCARCIICLGKSTDPCIRHDKKECRHHDCGHYIRLNSNVLCCKAGTRIPLEPLQPWIEALGNLEPKQMSGTSAQGVKRKQKSPFSSPIVKRRKLVTTEMKFLKTASGPPEVSVCLPKIEDLPKESVLLDDSQLPIDFLLLTVKECEFLGCLAYMNPGFSRCYRDDLGRVYLGDMGKARVAVMKCNMGSSGPGSSSGVVRDAIRVLGPKAVFCVGFCGGLNTDKIKLGDVVVSEKLITYAPSKVTQDGIEERGVRVPLRNHFSKLILDVDAGWKAPLKDPGELEVKIHRGALLSGPVVVDSNERRNELIKRFPDGIAIEMEGEGVFAAAHDMDVEWIIIKGISGFADGKKSNRDSWRPFASLMAASLTAHILSDPIVFQSWRHYGIGNTTTPF